MEICGPRCIEVMNNFLDSLVEPGRQRALDVAGGDGRFARGLLVDRYDKVDLFDQCETACGKAEEALRGHPNFGFVTEASMQDWEWDFQYDGIYMIWCVGYLTKPQLIQFLMDAKVHLQANPSRTSRHRAPTSFIFVLDNILDGAEESYVWKGQRLRHQRDLESIFADAGLIVHKRSERVTMPQDNNDVMIWALY